MRIWLRVGTLAALAALVVVLAAPAAAGAATRPGGTVLEEMTDYLVFVRGVHALTDEVAQARAAAAAPAGPGEVAPAIALQAGLDQIVASSGRAPFRLAYQMRCRFAMSQYRFASRFMRTAARYAQRGRATQAESSQGAARRSLETAGRWLGLCQRSAAHRLRLMINAGPRSAGTYRLAGFSFSRIAPLVPVLAPRATLTAPSCPAASDEALGVVVAYAGVTPGSALQVAFGKFPGTGFPSVSPGVVLTQAAATVAAQVPVPVPGIAAGAADGEYVAVLALDGRPFGGARFTIDCA